jgi:hypothetical protein
MASPPVPSPSDRSFTGDFTPGPGGVMTDEVGVITGELTLRTDVADDGAARLAIQYLGAEEWYAVTNGRYQLDSPDLGQALHDAAVAHLATGGADAQDVPVPRA